MCCVMHMLVLSACSSFFTYFFFFNDTATTYIYTLSLHDALPISPSKGCCRGWSVSGRRSITAGLITRSPVPCPAISRSEEHTSELQSLRHLVCRLLLEKKNKQQLTNPHNEH